MSSGDFPARLSSRAAAAGLELSPSLTASLVNYYELLQRWNRTINLTSLTDEDQAIHRLLLEPVAAARHLPSRPFRLLDIGSGGGSPAIPMTLAAPVAALTMVESRSRKAAFLREAVRFLGLSGATVEPARLEEIADRRDWRGAWDVISSRGVSIGAPEIDAVSRLLRPGGVLALFVSTPALPPELASGSSHDCQVHPLLKDPPSFLALVRLTPV